MIFYLQVLGLNNLFVQRCYEEIVELFMQVCEQTCIGYPMTMHQDKQDVLAVCLFAEFGVVRARARWLVRNDDLRLLSTSTRRHHSVLVISSVYSMLGRNLHCRFMLLRVCDACRVFFGPSTLFSFVEVSTQSTLSLEMMDRVGYLMMQKRLRDRRYPDRAD